MWLRVALFHSFLWLRFHCVSVSLLMDIGLLPCPGYCKQCCSEHWSACIFLNYDFLQIHTQEWDCWIIWQFLGFFFKFFIYLFLAVLGLCCYAGFSLVVVSGSYSLVVVHTLLIPGAFLLPAEHWLWGFSSCGFWALEQRRNSCGMWAQLLLSMSNLPGSGIEPMSPALAGRFFTTGPPGKPYIQFFKEPPYCSPSEKAMAPHSSTLAWKI